MFMLTVSKHKDFYIKLTAFGIAFVLFNMFFITYMGIAAITADRGEQP